MTLIWTASQHCYLLGGFRRHEIFRGIIVCTLPVLCCRLVAIMLLKLPIMRWSNGPEFYPLCSNYAP